MNMKEALETVEVATAAGDLFAGVAQDVVANRAGKRQFRRLALLIHPDRAGREDLARSVSATARLNELYRQWVAGSDAADEVSYIGESGEYRLGGPIAAGSVANLYRARTGTGVSVVLKIPRDCRANSMIEAERNVLTDLEDSENSPWVAAYFPRWVDRVTHDDAESGERREINVLGDLSDGFLTLSQVFQSYPDGLDPRDWAWMHRRLLRALAAAHHEGWVHTAILESNVLIHPDLHGVVLAGWSFATRTGNRSAATVASSRDLYPPEVGEPVSPAWDVYMVHGLMLRMIGNRIPSRMRAFAGGCMQTNPDHRPDAVDLLSEFDELLDQLYGERTFRPFTVPNTRRQ